MITYNVTMGKERFVEEASTPEAAIAEAQEAFGDWCDVAHSARNGDVFNEKAKLLTINDDGDVIATKEIKLHYECQYDDNTEHNTLRGYL